MRHCWSLQVTHTVSQNIFFVKFWNPCWIHLLLWPLTMCLLDVCCCWFHLVRGKTKLSSPASKLVEGVTAGVKRARLDLSSGDVSLVLSPVCSPGAGSPSKRELTLSLISRLHSLNICCCYHSTEGYKNGQKCLPYIYQQYLVQCLTGYCTDQQWGSVFTSSNFITLRNRVIQSFHSDLIWMLKKNVQKQGKIKWRRWSTHLLWSPLRKEKRWQTQWARSGNWWSCSVKLWQRSFMKVRQGADWWLHSGFEQNRWKI